MLIHSSKILNTPVLSLHTGSPIARTNTPIIDPATLKIAAFTVSGAMIGKNGVGDILDTRYIREFSSLGMIIDSIDDLTTRDDAIRIGKILELNFALPGKKVITKKGTRLGKVTDYTLDPATFQIHQLLVQRPPLKAIVDPELLISHSQITKVTDTEIIVKDEEQKLRAEATKEDFIPNFVNPFRKQSFAPIQSQTPDELDN